MNKDLQRSLHLLKLRFVIGGVLVLAAAVAFSVVWNRSVKEELAEQATMLVRRTLSMGDTRRVFESLNGVRLASFESITQFDRNGQRVVTLPPSIAPVSYQERTFWHRLIYAEIKTNLILDEDDPRSSIGSLSFVYSRFGLAHFAVGAWIVLGFFLSLLLINARERLVKEFEREMELQNSKFIRDLIQKVRHNIRSPLAVISTYFSAPPSSELDLREQGQRAIRRIEEILSEMEDVGGKGKATEHRQRSDRKALVDVSLLAEEIVEEKKLIAKNVEISLSIANGPIYAALPAMEFKTTLSNLIDNSIQAITKKGIVGVRLEGDGHLASLEISDTGSGIPNELISKVTEKHFSYGKEGGSGLGLFYAQKLMEESMGSLQIESELGCGTTVRLNFPQEPTPSWHCSEVSLRGIEEVHVYDDQAIVLDLFRQKFSSLNVKARYHLVEESMPAPRASAKQVHFMDFDFGPGKRNGIEIAAQSGVAKQTILVTGHYDDPGIQAACAQTGCRLLPKGRISAIRITDH